MPGWPARSPGCAPSASSRAESKLEGARDAERTHSTDRLDAVTLSRLQDELRLVEEEIDSARSTAEVCRARIGERAEGATDLEDMSAAIGQAEEQEELLGILTTRREKVQERIRTLLGADG